MPVVELTLDQLAAALQQLTPGEADNLILMLDPKLKRKLKDRWELARREYAQGQTVSPEEIFKALDRGQCIEGKAVGHMRVDDRQELGV